MVPTTFPIKTANSLHLPKKPSSGYAPGRRRAFDPIASYARAEEDARNDNELARKYPLFSVQQKTYRSVHSTFNNLEWMDEVCDQKPVVLMNVADAETRGIQDGDAVVVFNDRGEHHGVALVNDLIKPG